MGPCGGEVRGSFRGKTADSEMGRGKGNQYIKDQLCYGSYLLETKHHSINEGIETQEA